MKNGIGILLPTYNSEKYLPEQIDSLVLQSYSYWHLWVRDDGSSDSTLSVLKAYQRQLSGKITIVEDSKGKLGASKSFETLMECCSLEYLMFCDHDDVWLPSKIEKTFKKMKEIEEQHPQKALLVFTDLKVVDINLNIISNSMWKYQKTNPQHAKDFYSLSISNPVTGCTVMINQKAKEISLPMSSNSLMHDLWIALNVSHYGFIDFIDEPTVLYRQHSENVIGARKINSTYYISRLIILTKVISDNIKMIRMINSLSFKINHFRRILLKFKIVGNKLFR
jgi:glycosyltransferase involved in cell wall biosynthesis